MSGYYRVKKYRDLKRRRELQRNARENKCKNSKDSDALDNPSNNEVNSTNDAGDNVIHVEKEISHKTDDFPIVNDEFQLFQDAQSCQKRGINDKILQWTLQNLDTLRLNVVTDLLLLLREEEHVSLPKTAQALLGTTHHRMLQVMNSNRDIEGAYTYLGLQKGLEKIISLNVYRDSDISILIHIDGMQIFNNSPIQVWPIMVKICHTNYVCKPFIAEIYCGDSKPKSSNDYLFDFVKEAKNLISNGVELNGKKYYFKICAIIADAQVRAFIKYCKPPNSFYACERCVTKGVSVGTKRAMKRVYPEVNCQYCSKESFENKE